MAAMVFSQLSSDPRYVPEACGSLEKEYDLTASRVLGAGMSGCVRMAVHRESGSTHAVKTLEKRYASRSQLDDFKREIEVQLSLEHPLIVTVERIFETRNEIHMVMEHLKGGEMFDHVISKGRFSEEAGANAMRQMLTAVAHLHEHDIAHLDVKLENFVFASDSCDRLVLIDFGFATKCNEGSLNKFCGSLQMMAPEVVKGSYNASADIWSLGVVAYMMLCGNSPWAHSDAETRRMISEGRPMYRADFFELSSEGQDFIRSLLTVDPAMRPSAKTMLEHKWLAASPNLSFCDSKAGVVSTNMSDGESTSAEGSRQHSTADEMDSGRSRSESTSSFSNEGC